MERFAGELARLRRRAGLSQGELAKAAHWSQSQVSRCENSKSLPDEGMIDRLDTILGADGSLAAAARATGRAVLPPTAPSAPGRPWGLSDVVRRLHNTDVGSQTLEQMQLVTEQLCCEYAWRGARELHRETMQWLEYSAQLLERPTTLREHRDILVNAGWLTLLLGCLEYDLGNIRQAELSRLAALQIGKESGHAEIVGWTFELSAWFALTQGRLRSVAQYAEAGTAAAPHSSVVVQLAAQSAKAHARMGQRDRVHRTLDGGYRLLTRHDHPSRPENHFVIDPTKWDFYAMDCYRLVGDDRRATEHAHEVIHLSRASDGTEKSPMRATEARFTLGISALRTGDIESALPWIEEAKQETRRSQLPFAMLAQEAMRQARELYPGDPAAQPIFEALQLSAPTE
ncbi:helix-turn-helix domain-containing protein [Actinoalloteichus caeruleus]|uniref:helix-turn-helix domain-containing protein n=1 Tax=Actinoalloteichus cyanogriseus TaxID=2893586 RepID=UPI0004AA8493|nr:helix-turn-helix transcriptional regulator [Actinoalloteichus caeruleus]